MLAALNAAPGDVGDLFRCFFGEFEFDGIELRLPTRTFDGRLDVEVGGRVVELIEVGPAHTAGDTLAYVPDAATISPATSCSSAARRSCGPGPLSNWVAACDLMLGMDVETVVPGHGPVTDKARRRRGARLPRRSSIARRPSGSEPASTRGTRRGEIAAEIGARPDFARLGEFGRIAVNVDDGVPHPRSAARVAGRRRAVPPHGADRGRARRRFMSQSGRSRSDRGGRRPRRSSPRGRMCRRWRRLRGDRDRWSVDCHLRSMGRRAARTPRQRGRGRWTSMSSAPLRGAGSIGSTWSTTTIVWRPRSMWRRVSKQRSVRGSPSRAATGSPARSWATVLVGDDRVRARLVVDATGVEARLLARRRPGRAVVVPECVRVDPRRASGRRRRRGDPDGLAGAVDRVEPRTDRSCTSSTWAPDAGSSRRPRWPGGNAMPALELRGRLALRLGSRSDRCGRARRAPARPQLAGRAGP